MYAKRVLIGCSSPPPPCGARAFSSRAALPASYFNPQCIFDRIRVGNTTGFHHSLSSHMINMLWNQTSFHHLIPVHPSFKWVCVRLTLIILRCLWCYITFYTFITMIDTINTGGTCYASMFDFIIIYRCKCSLKQKKILNAKSIYKSSKGQLTI